ncbi:MAG: hypothetical protein MHPSP_002537, partial [Paramarteilia canceri]
NINNEPVSKLKTKAFIENFNYNASVKTLTPKDDDLELVFPAIQSSDINLGLTI